jgi:hypothetical protein
MCLIVVVVFVVDVTMVVVVVVFVVVEVLVEVVVDVFVVVVDEVEVAFVEVFVPSSSGGCAKRRDSAGCLHKGGAVHAVAILSGVAPRLEDT